MATAPIATISERVWQAAAEQDFKCLRCGLLVRKGHIHIGITNEAVVHYGFDQFCMACGLEQSGSPPIGTGGPPGLKSPEGTCPYTREPAHEGAAGQPPTLSQPAYPCAGVPGGGPQLYPASLQPSLDPSEDDEEKEGEGVQDAPMFNMSTSKDAILGVLAPLLADLPVPSKDGRFTNGSNSRGLRMERSTVEDFFRLHPHAPLCVSRVGVEKRATAAMRRSKAEAMNVFATSHVTMAVFVHEVISRDELQDLEAFQASTHMYD